MRINADLSIPTIVHGAQLDWLSSPVAGVERRMLFRVGGEVARATSIVRYAPGSAFPRHTHHGGEEILVLDGVFQDERGDYPAGSYFRNPPGSSHIPASRDGCTIFVRLWQFRGDDQAQIVRRPGEGQKVKPRDNAANSVALFDDGHEEVWLEDWIAGETVTVQNTRGLELLVLSGGFSIGMTRLEPQSWVRLPAGVNLKASIGPQDVQIWMKKAPLLHPGICELPS